jgi:phosphate starvation-inducible PhoH-like protein
MKMFLTRIGLDSKAVVTGDVTQIDLPDKKTSGLVEAQDVVAGIPGIEVVVFDKTDVVRHPLVQRIVAAYDERARRLKESRAGATGEERG